MRRLYILRHAKSDWPQGLDDRDRPLNDQGRRDAQALAKEMVERGYKPDIILCSSAKRTRETCTMVAEGANITYDDGLYLASTGHLYESLKAVDDKYKAVLLIGHNPGIHGLVQLLVGEGEPEHVEKILAGYKAGCLSVLECDCAIWSELLPAGNKLADLLIGKEHV